MPTASIEVYVAAFVARCNAMRHPACQMVNEPGVHGLLPFSDEFPARVLVTDDTAEDVLGALLPSIGAGTISVLAAAPRCTELVTNHQGWKPKAVTAMINSDLRGCSRQSTTTAWCARPPAP